MFDVEVISLHLHFISQATNNLSDIMANLNSTPINSTENNSAETQQPAPINKAIERRVTSHH